MIITTISSIFAYDKESTIIEAGDDELIIAYYRLDTIAYDTNIQGITQKTTGSGGLSTSQYQLPKSIDLSVVDDRYEAGSKVFSTLDLEIPQQLLSSGGYFEYNLISPDGVETELKTIRLEDNKDKLLTYDLPNDAEDGNWQMKGTLKINGYEDISVYDSFKVKNYSLYLWYLLAIILISTFALIIYLRSKNKNNIYYN